MTGVSTEIPWHHRFAPHMLIALPLPVILMAMYLAAFGWIPILNAVVISLVCCLPIALGVYDIKTRELPEVDGQ